MSAEELAAATAQIRAGTWTRPVWEQPVSEQRALWMAKVDRSRELGWSNPNYLPLVSEGLVSLGYTYIPQDLDRKPATVKGFGRIKWRDYQKRGLSPTEASGFPQYFSSKNVAIVIGPHTGLCVLDIDVTNADLADRIMQLADRMLGRSPVIRVGRAPKIAIFYRASDVQKRAFPLLDTDGRHLFADSRGALIRRVDGEDPPYGSDAQVIEVIGPASGGLITAYGTHHKTGKPFFYPRRDLAETPITDLPVVDKGGIRTFLEAVDKTIVGVELGRTRSPVMVDYDAAASQVDGSLQTPHGVNAVPGASYNSSVTRVIDGRKNWVLKRVFAWVSRNRDCALIQEAGLRAMVHAEAERWIERSGEWNQGPWRRVEECLTRTLSSLREGTLQLPARRVTVGEDGVTREVVPVTVPTSADSELEWAQGPKRELKNVSDCGLSAERVAANKLSRALTSDPARREMSAKKTAHQIHTVMDGFIDRVEAVKAGTDDVDASMVGILKAPAGAGKTTNFFARLAARKSARKLTAKFGLMMPTFANMSEAVSTNARLGGSEITVNEDEVKAAAARAGLNVLIFRGKIASGCVMAEQIRILGESSQGSSELCHKRWNNKDGETEEAFCDRFAVCAYQRQKRLIEQADLVIFSHAYVDEMPKELKDSLDGIIIDERIWPELIWTNAGTESAPDRFSLDTLRSTRRPPKLTKKEREDGIGEEDLVVDRDRIVPIVIEALKAGRDVGADVLAYRYTAPSGRVVTGRELVASCIAVTNRNKYDSKAVMPNMSVVSTTEATKYILQPRIMEEWRFWSIVAERVDALVLDKAADTAAQATGIEHTNRHAKGKVDARIQLIDGHFIRLSHRREVKIAGLPTLMLDASAAPDMIAKIWSGVRVITHEVEAPMHLRVVAAVDRTYSDSSILPSSRDEAAARMGKAATLMELRDLTTTVSVLYGAGRVMIGSSMKVRRQIFNRWAEPESVDKLHFGALRGLDFGKHHMAAISIGRMELPARAIDALVAALTYDDDEPEAPFDRLGTGVDEVEKPLRCPSVERRIQMRSGRDYTIPVPTYPGRWAAMVQRQYREEELMQFLGRLRPVYRTGQAPVWIAITSCIPEGVIVDELVSLADISRGDSKRARIFEAARRTGVIEAELSALPGLIDKRVAGEAASRLSKRRMGREAYGVAAHVRGEAEEHLILVPGFAKDPLGEAYRALSSKGLIVNPRDIYVVSEPELRTHEGVKAPDKVDAEMGTRAERGAMELADREKLMTEAENLPRNDGLMVGLDSRRVSMDIKLAWMHSQAGLQPELDGDET